MIFLIFSIFWYFRKYHDIFQSWGIGRGRSPPRSLFAVPNLTAHPSTASVRVPIDCCIMVGYSAVLMCPLKGKSCQGILQNVLLLVFVLFCEAALRNSWRRYRDHILRKQCQCMGHAGKVGDNPPPREQRSGKMSHTCGLGRLQPWTLNSLRFGPL